MNPNQLCQYFFYPFTMVRYKICIKLSDYTKEGTKVSQVKK